MSKIRLFAVYICLTSLLYTGCQKQYDIVIVADQVFSDVVLSQQILQGIERQAHEAGVDMAVYRYDTEDATGSAQSNLVSIQTPVVVLSPELSRIYIEGADPSFSAAVEQIKQNSTKVVLFVSDRTRSRISSGGSPAQEQYIVYSAMDGWGEADALLASEYEDVHKIGILYNPSVFGNLYDIDQLFPELFKDAIMRPEVFVFEGSLTSDMKIKDAMKQLAERKVEVVCVVLGGASALVLPYLKNGDMLAIIEQGGYIPNSHDVLLGSIEYEYDTTFSALFQSLREHDEHTVVPFKQHVVLYRDRSEFPKE